MLAIRVRDATRVLGESQGYRGLPVRDEVRRNEAGQQIQVMVSAWQPTPTELALLMAGASIHLTVLGSTHPPVIMSVGPAPEEEA